jgi:hypothetical protein
MKLLLLWHAALASPFPMARLFGILNACRTEFRNEGVYLGACCGGCILEDPHTLCAQYILYPRKLRGGLEVQDERKDFLWEMHLRYFPGCYSFSV